MSAPCRLYLITPPDIPDLAAFGHALAGALEAGDVAALQIRLKDAPEAVIAAVVDVLTPICRSRDVMVILNDDPALAARLGCDGVHVGQSDMPLRQARAVMGKDAVIGVTCHDSLHLAMDAAEGGADYVAFGAFYPTITKDTVHRPDPEILTGWQADMLIPCVAIGGITVERAREMAAAGADYLAVSAGVWAYPEGPVAAVKAFDREMAAGVAERVRG
jgi:thiamine-phosphate pyrophosphorylase